MSETGNIKISDSEHLYVKGSTKVEFPRELAIKFIDKTVVVPYSIIADLKDLDPIHHETAVRVINNFNSNLTLYNGHFTSDGKDATPQLNSKPKNSEPWECEKCGAIIGIVGKKLEKWLPFFFSHRCKPTIKRK